MRLAPLFEKYGTDKLAHGYADFYEVLLAHRRTGIQALLEIGIGTMIPGAWSSMAGFGGPGYRPGGSLRAWRDWMPYAQIYGLDTQPDTTITDEARITTILGNSCDQMAAAAFRVFDVIIDDGSHSYDDQMRTFRAQWGHLAQNGLYVIEDLTSQEMINNWRELRHAASGAPLFFVGPANQAVVIAKV
jgi:hypothetical protein